MCFYHSLAVLAQNGLKEASNAFFCEMTCTLGSCQPDLDDETLSNLLKNCHNYNIHIAKVRHITRVSLSGLRLDNPILGLDICKYTVFVLIFQITRPQDSI